MHHTLFNYLVFTKQARCFLVRNSGRFSVPGSMLTFANGLSPCSTAGDRYGFPIRFPYTINDRVFRQFVIMVHHKVLVSGSMGCLVASLFVMSVMLFKFDSYGFGDSYLAKLRNSFDEHWYTLIASISLSKWKSPSIWNLLNPVSLGNVRECLLTHVSVDSILTCIKGYALVSERRCTINYTNVYIFRIFCFTFAERHFLTSSVSCF